VVLNSHQLPEIERLCDRVAFLEQGRVTRVEGLRSTPSSRRRWMVQVPDARAEDALAALHGAGLAAAPADGGRIVLEATDEEASGVAAALVGAGVPLMQLAPAGPDLERLFRRA
jgi:ABC-type multidrug transport system ATPase subunit